MKQVDENSRKLKYKESNELLQIMRKETQNLNDKLVKSQFMDILNKVQLRQTSALFSRIKSHFKELIKINKNQNKITIKNEIEVSLPNLKKKTNLEYIVNIISLDEGKFIYYIDYFVIYREFLEFFFFNFLDQMFKCKVFVHIFIENYNF